MYIYIYTYDEQGYQQKMRFKILQSNLDFATNSKLLIPIFFQPNGVNL